MMDGGQLCPQESSQNGELEEICKQGEHIYVFGSWTDVSDSTVDTNGGCHVLTHAYEVFGNKNPSGMLCWMEEIMYSIKHCVCQLFGIDRPIPTSGNIAEKCSNAGKSWPSNILNHKSSDGGSGKTAISPDVACAAAKLP